MQTPLPREEQRYLDELLVWDEKRRPVAVLVPGVLAGLFFIAVYRVLRMRLRERHEIARLARKLMGPG